MRRKSLIITDSRAGKVYRRSGPAATADQRRRRLVMNSTAALLAAVIVILIVWGLVSVIADIMKPEPIESQVPIDEAAAQFSDIDSLCILVTKLSDDKTVPEQTMIARFEPSEARVYVNGLPRNLTIDGSSLAEHYARGGTAGLSSAVAKLIDVEQICPISFTYDDIKPIINVFDTVTVTVPYGINYTSPDGRIMSDWREDKAFCWFNTIHRFFRKCGADFLKVDNQSMTRRYYKGVESVGKVTHTWHRGLEASVGLNFDNTMINCMGMASEDMWNRSYSSISRCSDDFQPENRPWFTKHILQCTYNSILQGQFYWNDYDMWWTDDTQATKNSLLRAVSGGPIYVSDEIGRSNADILKPLAFDDGRILRCDRSGMPTADCLTVDPETSDKPLKIQNIVKNSGVIAAFNITKDQNRVTGTVSSGDIPGLTGERFAVYEYFTGKYRIVDAGEPIEFSLENIDDFRLFIFVPYIDNFAAIGRIDKFIAPAAITQQIGEAVTLYENGKYAYIKDGILTVEER